MNHRCRKPLIPALQDKATDTPVVAACPYDENIGQRRIGDPHLDAIELPASGGFYRPRPHPGRVGAVIRLGQTKAANPLAAGQFRQISLPLLLIAIFKNGKHDQTGLHTEHRPKTRINLLNFIGNQPIAHGTHPGTTITGERHPQQAQSPQFRKNGTIRRFITKSCHRAR